MAEYIEREAAISTACKGCNKDFANEPCEPTDCSIQRGLFAIPTADVVEVRHGEWIYDHWCEFKCSECGHFSKTEPRGKENYCPNCGAKMDGNGDGE